jgi:hypothetical protein
MVHIIKFLGCFEVPGWKGMLFMWATEIEKKKLLSIIFYGCLKHKSGKTQSGHY